MGFLTIYAVPRRMTIRIEEMRLHAVALMGLTVIALAGCQRKEEVLDVRPKDSADVQDALSKEVELPPSIAASRQFRCTDNSLLFVDFYSDGRSASVRTAKDGAPIRVTAAKAGDPMTGGDATLKGGKDDRNVSATLPGGKSLSCHL